MHTISGMQTVGGTQPTARYAQRCTGGVYTGIVGVYLGYRAYNRVKVCGNGRIHVLTERSTNELRKSGAYATEPEYCKYHKLEATDTPTAPPQFITLEFQVSIHANIHYYATQMHDSAMTEDANYRRVKCTIKLKHFNKIDDDDGTGNFHLYKPQSFKHREHIPGEIEGLIEGLVNMNKYVLEFQKLAAHADVPGLYFGVSVGHPADQLAVLVGDKLFAQHKFNNAERHNKKIIHVALESVLAIFERAYDSMQEQSGQQPRTATQKGAINAFCQSTLDSLTERYIEGVLTNLQIVKDDRGLIYTSDMQEACEYERLYIRDALADSTWTFDVESFERGEIAKAFTRTPRVVAMPPESNMRALVYQVVSHGTEPTHVIDITVGGESSDAVRGGQIWGTKYNAFSAFSVFWAYAEIVHLRFTHTFPHYMSTVLQDALRLQKSIKSMKRSSNFALKRLRASCSVASRYDNTFSLISEHMLALSERFISFILCMNPSTSQPKFDGFVELTRTRLLEWVRLSHNGLVPHIWKVGSWKMRDFIENIPSSTSLEKMREFDFEGGGLDCDHVIYFSEFWILLLATQLNVLAKLKVAEAGGTFAVANFKTKNYFQVTSAQRVSTMPPRENAPPPPTNAPPPEGSDMEAFENDARNFVHAVTAQSAPERRVSGRPGGMGRGGIRSNNRRQSKNERDAVSNPQTTEADVLRSDRILTDSRREPPQTDWTDFNVHPDFAFADTTGDNTGDKDFAWPYPTADNTGDTHDVIIKILYPTSLYEKMFWKFENNKDYKMLEDKRFFFDGLRDAMQELRSRHGETTDDEKDLFGHTITQITKTTGCPNEETVGSVETYLKCVSEIMLRTLNHNYRNISKLDRELWFYGIGDELVHMALRMEQTLGFDLRTLGFAHEAFRCDYDGFKSNRHGERKECVDMLLRIYQELKRKAYTTREHESESFDGTDASEEVFGKFCTQNGQMVPSEFHKALQSMMSGQFISTVTTDSIFKQIRTNEPLQKRRLQVRYDKSVREELEEDTRNEDIADTEEATAAIDYAEVHNSSESTVLPAENVPKATGAWGKTRIFPTTESHTPPPNTSTEPVPVKEKKFRPVGSKTRSTDKKKPREVLANKSATPEERAAYNAELKHWKDNRKSQEKDTSQPRFTIPEGPEEGPDDDGESDAFQEAPVTGEDVPAGAQPKAPKKEKLTFEERRIRRESKAQQAAADELEAERIEKENEEQRQARKTKTPKEKELTGKERRLRKAETKQSGTDQANAAGAPRQKSAAEMYRELFGHVRKAPAAQLEYGYVDGPETESDSDGDSETDGLGVMLQMKPKTHKATQSKAAAAKTDESSKVPKRSYVAAREHAAAKTDEQRLLDYGENRIVNSEGTDESRKRAPVKFTTESQRGFVTGDSFKKLFLGNLKVHLYIEVVKTLHAHIQVLGNLETVDGEFNKSIFDVTTPTDHDESRNVNSQGMRRFLGGQYKQWWEHFQRPLAANIMQVRAMIFDNVLHMPVTNTDKLRRIFLRNADIQRNDRANLQMVDYTLTNPNLTSTVGYECTGILHNIGNYEIDNVGMMHIGTEYLPGRPAVPAEPTGDLPAVPAQPTGDRPKMSSRPTIIPKMAEDAISETLKHVKKIKGTDLKFVFTFRLFERQFIQIKLHDETCVKVPLDPRLVCESSFTHTYKTHTGVTVTEKTVFAREPDKKHRWNFNRQLWEYERETYSAERIAKIVQSAGDLHSELSSNCMLPAARSLLDICNEVHNVKNKNIQGRLLELRMFDRESGNVYSEDLHSICQQLQGIAAESRHKIEREVDKIGSWKNFTAEIEIAIRYRYPCLVILCDEALRSMQNREFLKAPTTHHSIDQIFVETVTDPSNDMVAADETKQKMSKIKTTNPTVQLTIVLPITVEKWFNGEKNEDGPTKKTGEQIVTDVQNAIADLVKVKQANVRLERPFVTSGITVQDRVLQIETGPETAHETAAKSRREYYRKLRNGENVGDLPPEAPETAADVQRNRSIRDKYKPTNTSIQLFVTIETTTNEAARAVAALLNVDSMVEVLTHSKIIRIQQEFRIVYKPRVVCTIEQTSEEIDRLAPIKKIYHDLTASLFGKTTDVILPSTAAYESNKHQIVSKIELLTTQSIYKARLAGAVEDEFRFQFDNQITPHPIPEPRYDFNRTDATTVVAQRELNEMIVLRNRIRMLNFLIHDCLKVVIGTPPEYLLITRNDDIAKQVGMQDDASNLISEFRELVGPESDIAEFVDTFKELSLHLKKMYSVQKSEHGLRYNSTNASDILDFLQKQWLLYRIEILTVNLDDETNEEQKFALWKKLVIRFLDKLEHKHTETQLNAVYLYVNSSKIKKMIQGLTNLELYSINQAVDMTDRERKQGRTPERIQKLRENIQDTEKAIMECEKALEAAQVANDIDEIENLKDKKYEMYEQLDEQEFSLSELRDAENVKNVPSNEWFDDAFIRLGQSEEDVLDPIYFGRKKAPQDRTFWESAEMRILGLQGRSIEVALAAAEVASENVFNMNDGGRIQKCFCREITFFEAEIGTSYASCVDSWLNVILTTMHIQLSYFKRNREYSAWSVNPGTLGTFLSTAGDRYMKKWLGTESNRAVAVKDVRNSDFGLRQIGVILDCADKYDKWVKTQNMENVDANSGESEPRETQKTPHQVKANKRGYTRHHDVEEIQQQQGYESTSVWAYLNVKIQRNKAIFKSDLEHILSRMMIEYVYPCIHDEEERRLFQSTFNSAINNESVALFMSEEYLFGQIGDPTAKTIKLHGHMSHMLDICRAWYAIPDITYTDQPSRVQALNDGREQTYISEFKVLYMSEERNRAFHRNRVG